MSSGLSKKINDAHSSLIYSLILVGNHEYLDDMNSLSRGNIRFYGIRLSLLHAVMNQRLNQFGLNSGEKKEAVQVLWNGGSREEKIIALWIVSEQSDLLQDITWNEILVWSGSPDNWEVADLMALKILEPWILRSREKRLDYLEILVAENNYWRRSMSIHVVLSLNRSGAISLERTLTMIEKVLPDDHPIVSKALRIALLELVNRNPERLSMFFLKHRGVLPVGLLAEVEREIQPK